MNNLLIKQIVVISFLCVSLSTYCQEPDNHLGWTFSELKVKFPNLLEIRKQGDWIAYATGNPEEGFASYYVVKSNVIISEMNLLNSKDDLAKNTFDTMLNVYIGSYPSFLESKDKNGAIFKFSSFSMEVTYKEGDINTMITRFDLTNNLSLDESSKNGKSYKNPVVKKNYAHNLKVVSVSIQTNQTILTLSDNNQASDGDFYEWISLDKNSYIVADGQKYTLKKAIGIALSPDKTYFSYAGESKTFSLYFPPIPDNTTSIDFVENEDSEWKLYGIQLK